MNLTSEEKLLSKKARQFVIRNRENILRKYADKDIYKKQDLFPRTAFFTAGMPGAGKTEYATYIVEGIKEKYGVTVLHIDIDAYREFIPQYNGKNSYVVQSAATKAVEYIFDHAHNKRIDYILDTTLATDKTVDSVKRAIKRGRAVFIDYIYLAPEDSWQITKAREKITGRHVPLSTFVEAYVNSINNVNLLKKEFEDSINLSIIIKEEKHKPLFLNLKKFEINVKNIESHLPKIYTKEELLKLLND